ncbi:hypothetical protein ACHAWF_018173, partial [Thalassiosira exigua]
MNSTSSMKYPRRVSECSLGSLPSDVLSPQQAKENSLFPFKLHEMLEHASSNSEHADSAVLWIEDGRAFAIKDKDALMNTLAPMFFNQTKFRSFTRQLNLWGFKRLRHNEWRHEHFVRGNVPRMRLIERTEVKGGAARTGRRRSSLDDADLFPDERKGPKRRATVGATVALETYEAEFESLQRQSQELRFESRQRDCGRESSSVKTGRGAAPVGGGLELAENYRAAVSSSGDEAAVPSAPEGPSADVSGRARLPSSAGVSIREPAAAVEARAMPSASAVPSRLVVDPMVRADGGGEADIFFVLSSAAAPQSRSVTTDVDPM